MFKMGYKNLRSLNMEESLEIKPITTLVGLNSSGKSTFLRALMLLKQSFDLNNAAPIIWYNYDNQVDFGSFDEAINNNASEEEIMFSFEFLFSNIISGYSFEDKREEKIPIKINSTLKKSGGKEYISKVEFEFFGNNFLISHEKKNTVKVKINNEIFEEVEKKHWIYPFKLSTLIPEIHVGREKLFAEIDEDIFDVEKLGKLMNKKNSFEIEILGRKKNSKKQEEFLKFFSLIEKILRYEEFAELITKFSKITLKKNDTMKYYNLFLAYNLYKINMNISITLCKIIENVEYITPLRAMSERYYRINSNIRKIDPSGRNLATYISNFSETDMIKLKKWLIENFQFSIDLKESTGHNSIKVIDASNNEGANIIDTGFGYSQILPILINLWEISNKTNKSRQYDKNLKILLIEQPELHLHPAFQAKLTDVIINLVEKTKEKIDFRIIMETHSETIINRICNQIGKGNLNKEDISLLIFEKEKIGTVIKEAEFDDEGYLTNWPYGFFEPEGVK